MISSCSSSSYRCGRGLSAAARAQRPQHPPRTPAATATHHSPLCRLRSPSLALQDDSNPDFVSEVVELYFEDSASKIDTLEQRLREAAPSYSQARGTGHGPEGAHAHAGAACSSIASSQASAPPLPASADLRHRPSALSTCCRSTPWCTSSRAAARPSAPTPWRGSACSCATRATRTTSPPARRSSHSCAPALPCSRAGWSSLWRSRRSASSWAGGSSRRGTTHPRTPAATSALCARRRCLVQHLPATHAQRSPSRLCHHLRKQTNDSISCHWQARRRGSGDRTTPSLTHAWLVLFSNPAAPASPA